MYNLWLSLIYTGGTQNHSVCIFISAMAETHKNAGNDAFLKGDFVKAINLYTEGIEVKCKDEDLNAKLYNNRASAHFHLGKVSFIYYIYSTHCQHCILFRIQHSIVYSASLPFFSSANFCFALFARNLIKYSQSCFHGSLNFS